MGRHATVPNPENHSLEELSKAIQTAVSKREHLRLSVISSLLKNHSREVTCDILNVSQRTLLRCIQKYNKGSIDALLDPKNKGGRPTKISNQTFESEYVEILENPDKHGQNHWTGTKFYGYLKQRV